MRPYSIALLLLTAAPAPPSVGQIGVGGVSNISARSDHTHRGVGAVYKIGDDPAGMRAGFVGIEATNGLTITKGTDTTYTVDKFTFDTAALVRLSPASTQTGLIDVSGTITTGNSFRFTASPALATCSSSTHGRISRQGGTASARTYLCVCTSDGAGSPTFAWMNIHTSGLGDTTSCP